MAQAVGGRPGPVVAAQVIIWVLAVLAALGSVLLLVLGIVGIVSGASVAAGSTGSEAAEFGTALGGLMSMFSGAVVAAGVVSLAFVALWMWIATALGRGSRAARITATVLCALDLAWGLVAVLVAAGDQEAASAVLPALVMIGIPAVLIGLLWGPESARRFFVSIPAVPAPRPAPMAGYPMPPVPPTPPVPPMAPMSPMPPPGMPRPTPHVAAPLARCRTCGTGLRPGWAHCGTCGAPTAPPRPVGA